ncbi:MAG TPA: hypothetical protein VEX38_03195 [Fimbriimonadaceae bacterium]|nr:hypothetical protein [Fimbriimonadaceae bacterium]
MRSFLVLFLLTMWAVVGAQRMDRSISGKTIDKYHESQYDARLRLYLYSGGD